MALLEKNMLAASLYYKGKTVCVKLTHVSDSTQIESLPVLNFFCWKDNRVLVVLFSLRKYLDCGS